MFDSEFWIVFAFVTFLGTLGYLAAHKRLVEYIDRRHHRTESELDEARRLKELARGLLAECQRKQRETEQEAAAVIASAEGEAKKLVADAKAKMDQIVAYRNGMAESKISQAEDQALAEVRAGAVKAAVGLTHTILSRTVKGDVGDHLSSKGVDDVKAKLG
jgi:F-type H+-transporting ATPase subunit b